MKKAIYLMMIFIVILYGSSCKSGNEILFKNNSVVTENIYWRISDFYDAYLRFPKDIEELNDFIWQIINVGNRDRYDSYESYLKSKPSIISRDMETINFLLSKKDEIKIYQKEDNFVLTHKHKKIKVKKNICEDLEKPLEECHFIHSLNSCEVFDVNGKILQNNYRQDFTKLLKSTNKRYLHKYFNIDTGKLLYSAFRYDKRNGLSEICPNSIKFNVKNSLYLKELSFSLDTFISKRNINTIQFIIGIPKEKHDE